MKQALYIVSTLVIVAGLKRDKQFNLSHQGQINIAGLSYDLSFNNVWW